MHYKNGREAKNGDKVVLISAYQGGVIGILYDAVVGNDTCNGRIAPILPSDPCPNLQECLHLDDVKATLVQPVRNTSAPPPTVEELDKILNSESTDPVNVNEDGSVMAA
jgi:phosphopantetheine adenylyltransferase